MLIVTTIVACLFWRVAAVLYETISTVVLISVIFQMKFGEYLHKILCFRWNTVFIVATIMACLFWRVTAVLYETISTFVLNSVIFQMKFSEYLHKILCFRWNKVFIVATIVACLFWRVTAVLYATLSTFVLISVIYQMKFSAYLDQIVRSRWNTVFIVTTIMACLFWRVIAVLCETISTPPTHFCNI